MTRRILFTLLTLSLCCTAFAAAETSPAPTLRERLAEQLDALAADGFAGVVLIAREDRILLHEGYGEADPERDLAMPGDAVFTIGSIAKPFTAVAVLRLVEAGALQVDAPLRRFFPDAPADKRDITLHQLLTHSAGLPGAIGQDFDFVDRDTYVAMAMAEPLRFQPGERYEYSNVGYSLLAAVIEIATGKPYVEILRREVLEPAGLAETGFDAALWPTDRLAQGYRDGERWGTVTERFDARGPSWHLLGNGGLHSTATDMFRFHQALLGDRLLSAASKALAFTPHVAEDDAGSSHYGYGWAIFEAPGGGRLIAHNGGNRTFFADFQRYLDDELTIFLACSRMVRGVGSLGETLARIVLDPSYRSPAAEPTTSLRVDRPTTDGDPLAAAWGLRDSHEGRLAARFLAAIGSDTAEKRRRCLDGLFARRLIDQIGLDALVGMAGQLADDFGAFTLRDAILRGSSRIELTIEPASGEGPMLLTLRLEGDPPRSIDGIEIDGG